MLKKTVNFTDFNGIARSQDLYFHISKTSTLTSPDDVYNEIMSIGEELQERGQTLEKSQEVFDLDNPFDPNTKFVAESVRMVARLLDRLVDLAYGVKSDDGRRFIKGDAVLIEFKQSAAYDAFVEQMLDNYDDMLAFIKQLTNEQ